MAKDKEMLEGGGALFLHGKRKTPPARSRRDEDEEAEEEEEEEREIEDLEREVTELGRKILDSRRTLPERLLQALSARLLALRPTPPLPRLDALVDAVNTSTSPEMQPPSDLNNGGLMAEADHMTLEKVQALRAKIASNVSSMPEVLRRTNECIAKIEELQQHNIIIHPVFKRNRL